MNLVDEDYNTQIMTDLSSAFWVDMELYYDLMEHREGVYRFARLAELLQLKCLHSDFARWVEM